MSKTVKKILKNKQKLKSASKEASKIDFSKYVTTKIAEVIQSPTPRAYGILITFVGQRAGNEVMFAGINTRLEFCQEITPQIPPAEPAS